MRAARGAFSIRLPTCPFAHLSASAMRASHARQPRESDGASAARSASPPAHASSPPPPPSAHNASSGASSTISETSPPISK